MTFRIIQQGTPLRWLCPHCEMEIEAEMLSEPDPERAYVCFFCGWRRSLAMMEYYGFVRPVEHVAQEHLHTQSQHQAGSDAAA